MIEDAELREIYQVSGGEHVQNLEAGLLSLEKEPQNQELLATLLREAHSLKGDSRVVGVKSVETLAHQLEELFGGLKNGTLEWSKDLGDAMYTVVGALGKLVHEAVTDEASGVNPDQLSRLLEAFLPQSQTSSSTAATAYTHEPPSPIPQSPLFIEDESLREIYSISQEEHLNKIKAHLSLLEENPDWEIPDELIKEIESFELDSRFVGLDIIENILHKFRGVCETFKQKSKSLPLQANKTLQQTLQVVSSLCQCALNGAAIQVDYEKAIGTLEHLQGQGDEEEEKKRQYYGRRRSDRQLDTIRVPTQYLDALMIHTGELRVAKTSLAHIEERIKDLKTIWEGWKKGGGQKGVWARLDELVSLLQTSIAENNSRLETICRELDDKVRTLRLLPLSTIFLLFPRVVRDLAAEQGKQVEFVMEGGELTVDKQILEDMKDPLLHLLRNAVDHGIETPAERQEKGKNPVGRVWLKATATGSNVVIEVGDDGRGLDLDKIRQTALKRKLYTAEQLAQMTPQQLRALIFLPGFSTRSFVTEISGRGVGLDVLRNNVEKLKGNISLESSPGGGTVFRITVPSTVSSLNVMLFEVQGIVHALPTDAIVQTLLIKPEEIYTLEGRPTISVGGQPVTLVKMADLLQLPATVASNQKQKRRTQQQATLKKAIILQVEGEMMAFEVDDCKQVLDVVVKPQSRLLKRVRNVTGATILGNGDVCIILNPHDLVKSVRHTTTPLTPVVSEEAPRERKPVVLLVEDSIAVRTQEKRILEKAGYEVVIAVDGVDGYNKLLSGLQVDAIISDIEMPNMNGLEFTAKVRQHPEFREVPIIIVTSLAKEEDKRKGAQVGANAYIVKGQFNQDVLLETLDRLI
ncbi:MAG TPA: hybrid sensor histidine kinase/response regulator [Geminocystis sp. M7585_C2015_104]|nr:hybrid sensor histidine kinase/response regulator [Geminocystis sp. M7585_C2015_104]